MKRAVLIIVAVIVVLAIAGGSFYGGTVYAKNQAAAAAVVRRQNFQNGQGTTGQGVTGQGVTGQGRAGNMLFGTIKTVNPDGLVVTDSNGNEITVKVAGTTLIEKNMSVKVTDLAEGETVIISGQKAADGTITARSLQVAPEGRFSFQGGPPPVGQGGQGEGGPSFSVGGNPPPGGDAPPAP